MPLQVVGQELLKWIDSQGLPRRLELAAASTFGAADPTPLLANPFDDVDLDELRKWLATAVGGDPLDCLVVAAGQCFYLRLLWHLAFATGDLDLQVLRQLEDGPAMGVEEDLACPDGVLVRKLPREEVDASDDLWPHAEPNYSSAEAPENAKFLMDQFDEDVQEGMMDGPFACEAEVAAHLGCSTTQLVYGALAVRDEADGKKRALQDGTVVDVNEAIRSHIHHKGSSPASGDLRHALAIDTMEGVGNALLKADARKAHRRCKTLTKDRRHQLSRVRLEVKEHHYVNKVGTYGMADAQFKWGRLMGVVHRIILAFGFTRWLFTYVDDILALLNRDYMLSEASAMAILLAVGFPFS